MDIDVATLIGAATREVEHTRRDGADVREVRATRDFDTTVEDLWEAITDPERLPRWFLPVTGELHVGGRFQLQGQAGGEILTCDAPTHLAVTWEFGEQVSWLDVRLSPAPDGGTRLELSHTVPVDAHWEQFGPGAVGVGWDLALMGLVLHLASGEAVDPAAVAAWQASPEGLDLMRGSTAAWCDAHVEAGAPAAEAEGMRDRTLAAYTGG
jgi:uncharacterized protein YndB with AHSA1/START domain